MNNVTLNFEKKMCTAAFLDVQKKPLMERGTSASYTSYKS
jgi:hypothetical protein